MSLRFSGFLLDSFEQEYNAVSLSCWTPEELSRKMAELLGLLELRNKDGGQDLHTKQTYI